MEYTEAGKLSFVALNSDSETITEVSREGKKNVKDEVSIW